MPSFLLLDFDGTLYPIREHNSEELLLRLSGRKEAIELAERARKDRSDYEAFDRGFIELMRGQEASLADRAAELLLALVPEGFLEPLRTLKEAGYIIRIVSCGSGSVASAFAEKAGMAEVFDRIEARMLTSANGIITGIEGPISSPDEKRSYARALKEEGHYVAACGDGPTDIGMLSESDDGFVMAWDEQHIDSFPVIRSLDEMLEPLLGRLGGGN